MTLGTRIDEGDLVRCERCGRSHIVKNYEWETSVQVIVCYEGIGIVGIDHERLEQHTVVEYGQFGETA